MDGTRRGRLLPDSFSRTLPLWAACINKAVAERRRQNAQGAGAAAAAAVVAGKTAAAVKNAAAEYTAAEAASATSDAWTGRLYVPRATVPADEAETMQRLVHERVATLLQAQAPLDALAERLERPLRCCWRWRGASAGADTDAAGLSSQLRPEAFANYRAEEWEGEGSAEELAAQGFTPIVCLSATRPIHEQQGDGFVYLQVRRSET